MSRVFLCGLGPLPPDAAERTLGPGIRTWQFATGLASAGHQVRLVAMTIPGSGTEVDLADHDASDCLEILRLGEAEFGNSETVRSLLDEFGADAVVGATIYGSVMLARCETEIPFWGDQFGHTMAEAQAKAALDGENTVLPYFWEMVREVDTRVDKLSVVSERQRLAAIGELGAFGRLSSEACGYELVSVIPCSLVPHPRAEPIEPSSGHLPEEAFVVLWSGSYNVWSDVDALFEGLELAMAEDPHIFFLSTGGEVPGHDEETYERFRHRVQRSPYGERFLLEGWVPSDRVASYWSRAHLGVLTEHPIYEGALGSKNRVVQWMGYGLPVAYNRVGDLGDLLEEEGLGLTFDVGAPRSLADSILWASRNRQALRKLGERADRYTREELSIAETTRPLVEWAHRPLRAPDAATGTTLSPSPPSAKRRAKDPIVSPSAKNRWRHLRTSLARLLKRPQTPT